MDQPKLSDLLRSGYVGTQSGPVQESTSAGYERGLQGLAGLGMMGVGGYALSPGGPLGIAAGALPGTFLGANSAEPNIQDVWTHKFMQALRKTGAL